MVENRADRRIGHVVGGHVNGLNRGNVAAGRGRNSLFQLSHFTDQRWLIAHRGGHAPQEARDFAAGLNKSVGVVHQEKHFFTQRITQILGISQRRHADTKAHTGRLIHLAENHQSVGHDARLLHFAPEFMAFTNPFAYAGKDRNPLVQLRHRMHELHDQHGLTDPGTAEESGFSASDERAQKIDDLDAGFQNRRRSLGAVQRTRFRDDVAVNCAGEWRFAIQRFAEEIQQTAQAFGGYRHMKRGARVEDRHPPPQSRRMVQSDRARVGFIQMLVDLKRVRLVVELTYQRLMERRQNRAGDIDYRAVHLGDGANP